MVTPAGGPAGLSRRRFLEAGALTGAALLLGACGAEVALPSRRAEARVLAGLLARERAAIAGLGAALETLEGARAAQVRGLLAHDRRHAAVLGEALRVRGTPPSAAPAARATGSLERALADKEAALAAYVQALGGIADAPLRVRLAETAAAEAEHAAVLRMLLGADPVPGAFGGIA
ncbi:MAG TPA: twin-arginine translocation signal domain-containing protein [Solirubrobacteraceae bacterium]|nr:twin-arginine translocation signal domain-containing protein [Solirubrobacteraceae bacterium]